jgi:hypothetical protein
MGVLVLRSAALAQLPQELIRRDEEWVLLEDSADDDHRMGPHDVDHDLPAKLGEIVRSSDRVPVPRQQVVQPCFVLEQVIDARPILQRPFHVGDQAGQREVLLSTAFEDFLEESQHPVLIEVAVAQIGLEPGADLELSAPLRRVDIDPGRFQAAQMFGAQGWIHDVERFFATLESLFDEREHHPILLIRAVEEGAHVALRP